MYQYSLITVLFLSEIAQFHYFSSNFTKVILMDAIESHYSTET